MVTMVTTVTVPVLKGSQGTGVSNTQVLKDAERCFLKHFGIYL